MRRHRANDRLIASEIIASAVDGPENATFVRNGCLLSITGALEVTAASGTVTITGSDVSVNQQSGTVADITGQTTNTAYRYHTFSIDDTGALVVQSSNVGDFDASNPDQPPTTQVTEPRHPEGNVYLGTAFQIADQIEEIYNGRYIVGTQPNDIITQGEGSGLTADTVRGFTGLELSTPIYGDGSDGDVVFSSDQTLSENVYAESITIESGVTLTVADDSIALLARDSIEHNGTITADGAGGSGGTGGASTDSSPGDDGQPGETATYVGVNGTGGAGGVDDTDAGDPGGPSAGGGGGGAADANSGGDGGDASVTNPDAGSTIKSGATSAVTSDIIASTATIGSGGGGGGGGGDNSADSVGAGFGGDGGDGGGAVVLLARRISGAGSITAQGLNGTDGVSETFDQRGGGGGGGGGCGGAVLLAGSEIDAANISTDVSGGLGGAGGTASGADASDGGAGGDGDPGIVAVVKAPQTPL